MLFALPGIAELIIPWTFELLTLSAVVEDTFLRKPHVNSKPAADT